MNENSMERKNQILEYEKLGKLIGPSGASKKTATLIVQATQLAK
jgi:hypothetical protein